MAKKVKIELDKWGINEILTSDEVKWYLEDLASERAAGLPPGYEYDSYTGPYRCNSMIWTATIDAMVDNLKNNSLAKAVR